MSAPDPQGSPARAHAFAWVDAYASGRTAAGLRRTLRPRPLADDLLDLASNDYLGLCRHPAVVAAAQAATAAWGAGSTGSRLVTGSTELHADLERRLAELVGVPAALVFSSGYLANLGALVALTGPGSLVVSDAQNHASIVDACRLSRARVVVVPHRDVGAVADALRERPEERAVVVTDAVFSVEGERAPLEALAVAARAHGAGLLVDEAHSLGVLGRGGAGACAAALLAGAPDVVLTAALSKAVGAQGGVVLGSQAVVDHLVDSARSFIFDTGLAPGSVGAALAGLDLLRSSPGLPGRALANAREIHRLADAAGLDAGEPDAAVVGIRVGSPQAALDAAGRMAAAGVRVGCFRPPTVPDGVSRLRLTARADLTEDDLRLVAKALAAIPS